ncbi:Vesicle-associated membrane protein 1 [Myotis brandtii]|uniref:Vesicle-associated membrane protein 1 n=1 Tax=Myotis brandtii TaxID=109478 RepID=S7PNG0_MYOBR|nr:Vesicle-associated membrane protein 1 [Myotis brandtii]
MAILRCFPSLSLSQVLGREIELRIPVFPSALHLVSDHLQHHLRSEGEPWLEKSDPAQPPTEGAEGTAPGGGPPGPPPNTTSNRRLQQTQAQVEEVVDIMRVNVDKVLKRDEILSELDDRADALQMGASQFESSAAKLKRKYWWKNCKMMIMLGVICAIIVVVIAIYFFT